MENNIDSSKIPYMGFACVPHPDCCALFFVLSRQPGDPTSPVSDDNKQLLDKNSKVASSSKINLEYKDF